MTPALLDNRRVAARVTEQAQPGWMVVYGIYAKEYVAFPLFHAPPGTILAACYPPALTAGMQRAEALISGLSPPSHRLPARAGHVAAHAPAVPASKARAAMGAGLWDGRQS